VFIRTESITAIRRGFRLQFQICDAPSRNTAAVGIEIASGMIGGRNLTCGSGHHVTSVISSQCCDCCSRSLGIDCKTEVGSFCPVH
jgi:hypothetical protein